MHERVARPDNIYFLTAPVNFMDRGEADEMLAEILALPEKPVLVIIDTLARSMVGGEENSAKDVGLFIAGADRIRTEFNSAVVIVHHTGKSGDLERGSSVTRGAADAMIKLSADEGIITLTCEKMKDALPFEPCYLRLKPTEDGESCTVVLTSGSPVVAGQLTKNHKLVLNALAEFPEGEATYSRIREASGVPEGSIGRILKGLLGFGCIEKSKQKYAPTDKGQAYLTPGSIAIGGLS